MIKFQNVSKEYSSPSGPVVALKDVNLEIKSGEIFGAIGRSGAGKSTFIRCINLLERPSFGNIFVADKEMTQLSAYDLRLTRQKIGMIFQHFSLLSTKTVFENIAFPLQLVHTPAHKIQDIVLPLLDYVQLSDKKDQYPNKLSGGQKQRVAIARALANQPEILLCDEVTSALDPHTTKTILNLLQDVNKRFGITIVLITHEMQVVKQICDRVVLLEQGKIAEEADIIQFFTHPKSEAAQKLVKTCLHQELPSAIQTKITDHELPNTNPLVRIFFYGEVAKEPLISHLVKEFNLEVNIIQANIEVIKQHLVGIMTLEIVDTNQRFNEALSFLQTKKIQIEIIGYVRHNDH